MLVFVTVADHANMCVQYVYRYSGTYKYYYCSQTCYGPYLSALTDEDVIKGSYIDRDGRLRVFRTPVPLPLDLRSDLRLFAIRHAVS
jgi:hypothetical protein